MKNKKLGSVFLACIWLIFCVFLTCKTAYQEEASNYEQKISAAQLMQTWMDAIKEYKKEIGLPISDEDLHQTGLIGEEYTFITTTHGALEAKRTTANPDMAALLIQMLTEAGIKSGDTVGAGFSGSFPALNLAVLAACQTMDIHCIYISSVGSSTYGANQPELTFPDMIHFLEKDGLLSEKPALFTPGGYDDCGYDMDEELRKQVLFRLKGYDTPLMIEDDFQKNLAARIRIYQEQGPISCFIGVGGNLTTTGSVETNIPYGLLYPEKIKSVTKNSGLIQYYNANGLPVLHLLNIKQLVSDYGMPYDPEILLPVGKSAVYYQTSYHPVFAVLGILGALLFLILPIPYGILLTRYRNRV